MSSSTAPDWKEKYFSTLEEFELQQKNDQARLDLLRKGLVRVSLAAEGLDGTLDQQLDEMRSVLRSDQDVNSLEPLIAKLEKTVVNMEGYRRDRPEESGHAGSKQLVDRLSNTLCNLLSQLDVPENYTVRKANLVEEIRSPFEMDKVPDFLDETAQLVASTRMVAQKEFEGFLVALHQRLNDIQDFLCTARQGEEDAKKNQEKLDQDVRAELDSMRSSMVGNNDITKIKEDIESMVNRIVITVDAFHRDEKNRRGDVYQRIEALSMRMQSMESEASELKSSMEAQRLEALRDALTELPNRAAYDDQIEAEFSRWRRHERPLSISIIDIDHFKKINDTLGHLRGDKVLKLVAREISRRVRSEDFVARYGGEEFVVIMPDTDGNNAFTAMEKVRSAIEHCPFNFNNQRIPITASFGISSFTDGDEIEACFERADRALYQSKRNGRNRIETA